MIDKEKHKELLRRARSIKERFLGMYKAANAGHVGCSLSCAELMTYVAYGWKKPGDEIILSKGHAAAVLYSTLAEEGVLSEEDIATFYKNDSYLAAHPPTNKLKGIPFATGSLGHGLSIAAGLGLAAKLKGNGKKIFCITSDGEINEGSTWEAALFIVQQRLNDVVWLIDRNKLQGYGRTEDVMALEPLADKLRAFGYEVIEADGHDFKSYEAAKEAASKCSKPVAIICHTTKGKNWPTYEDKVDCHYLPMKDGQYELVMSEVGRFFNHQMEQI